MSDMSSKPVVGQIKTSRLKKVLGSKKIKIIAISISILLLVAGAAGYLFYKHDQQVTDQKNAVSKKNSLNEIRNSGDNGEALTVAESGLAAATTPEDRSFWQSQVAGAYSDQGNDPQALREYLTAYETLPGGGIAYIIADLYAEQGNASKAIEYYNKEIADLKAEASPNQTAQEKTIRTKIAAQQEKLK